MTNATSITVRVPLAIRHRPGRKTVVTPDVQFSSSTPTRADPALLKAMARAHRYQRMLEQGHHGSLTELAAAEKMDRSFLGKLISLTLLAPDLVEAILEGRCDVGLPTLLRPFPAAWHEQASGFAAKGPPPSLPETKARG